MMKFELEKYQALTVRYWLLADRLNTQPGVRPTADVRISKS
jgi:hypothetical protein